MYTDVSEFFFIDCNHIFSISGQLCNQYTKQTNWLALPITTLLPA